MEKNYIASFVIIFLGVVTATCSFFVDSIPIYIGLFFVLTGIIFICTTTLHVRLSKVIDIFTKYIEKLDQILIETKKEKEVKKPSVDNIGKTGENFSVFFDPQKLFFDEDMMSKNHISNIGDMNVFFDKLFNVDNIDSDLKKEQMNIHQLKKELEKAVENNDFERAAILRDEIKKRNDNEKK
ncbi:MAG: UvrB/UvrC motif-containing protein [Candidatus Izemoplasmatales bacterium]